MGAGLPHVTKRYLRVQVLNSLADGKSGVIMSLNIMEGKSANLRRIMKKSVQG